MIGRTLGGEEVVYNKYAEEAVPVSKAGVVVHINEQSEIIQEMSVTCSA